MYLLASEPKPIPEPPTTDQKDGQSKPKKVCYSVLLWTSHSRSVNFVI